MLANYTHRSSSTGGGIRTHTTRRSANFKSAAYTNSSHSGIKKATSRIELEPLQYQSSALTNRATSPKAVTGFEPASSGLRHRRSTVGTTPPNLFILLLCRFLPALTPTGRTQAWNTSSACIPMIKAIEVSITFRHMNLQKWHPSLLHEAAPITISGGNEPGATRSGIEAGAGFEPATSSL